MTPQPLTTPILSVEDLEVRATAGRTIVSGVSFTLARGETIGIVGESGSGKTTTALALMGYARHGMRIAGGEVTIDGRTVPLQDEDAARAIRGRVVSHVPQDPATNLNPSLRIGAYVSDMLGEHGRDASEPPILAALARVHLPAEHDFARRFPHQLSGGQQQRVLITTSLVCQPPLVILDEPTTGLDVITQAKVLAEIERLHREEGIAMVYVSHDLAVVAQVCDRIAVMHEGRIVEVGDAAQVLQRPVHPYTQRLVAATPDHVTSRALAPQGTDTEPLLEVDELEAVHSDRSGTVVAARSISFKIAPGECVALVGESGSGKTTIARAIAGLHPPASGRLVLAGEVLAGPAKRRSREQRRRCQIIFQNPYESLNPRRCVADEIARPAIVLRQRSAKEAAGEVDDLLERVELPARLARKLPVELSGGERQRVAIARALAAKPDLLICDEITSALDVSVQAAVIQLLNELRTEFSLSMLFITHNLGVVASLANRVLVLESGDICEEGPVEAVFANPQSPRTVAMLAAAPRLVARDTRKVATS